MGLQTSSERQIRSDGERLQGAHTRCKHRTHSHTSATPLADSPACPLVVSSSSRRVLCRALVLVLLCMWRRAAVVSSHCRQRREETTDRRPTRTSLGKATATGGATKPTPRARVQCQHQSPNSHVQVQSCHQSRSCLIFHTFCMATRTGSNSVSRVESASVISVSAAVVEPVDALSARALCVGSFLSPVDGARMWTSVA